MDWIKSLETHKAFAQESLSRDYHIICVSCVGSQNYTLESDFDSACLVIPTFFQLVREASPISTTLKLPNGEQMKVKDLRVFCREFPKSWTNWEVIISNLSYWTDYDLRNAFLENLEKFCYINPQRVLDSMRGQITKALVKQNPSPKELMRAAYIAQMAKSYYKHNKPISDILRNTDKQRKRLLDIKSGRFDPTYQLEQAITNIDNLPYQEPNGVSYNDLLSLCAEAFKKCYTSIDASLPFYLKIHNGNTSITQLVQITNLDTEISSKTFSAYKDDHKVFSSVGATQYLTNISLESLPDDKNTVEVLYEKNY